MAHGPIVLARGLIALPWRDRGWAHILREISGNQVYVASITPLVLLLGRIRGYGQLVFEIASTVDRALLESDSDKAILVGHSAGGVACRVFAGGDPPYGGRRFSGYRPAPHFFSHGRPPLGSPPQSPSPPAPGH